MRNFLTLVFAACCIGANAISVYISVNVFPTCNYPNGQLAAVVNGGVGPYTYLWSTGATTAALDGVSPGTYSVTVTDLNSDQATDDFTITGQPYYLSDLGSSGPLGLCSNGLTGVVVPGPGYDLNSGTYMGQPPFTIDGQLMQEYVVYDWGAPVDTLYTWNEPAPQYGVDVTYAFADGAGCTGTLQDHIGYPVEWPALSVLDIQGACSNGNNGSITFQTGLEGHAQWTQVKIETITNQYLISFGAGNEIQTYTWNLPAGDYLLTQFMSESPFLVSSGCNSSTPFTIPDLGTGCGNISGTVFMDNNEDCAYQGGEPGAGSTLLEILPGPYYAFTDAYGRYGMNLPLGSYSLEEQSATLEDHCLSQPAPFALALGSALQTLNVADTALVPMDASVSLASGAARPGFQLALSARMTNLTLASTGASTLSVTFDPLLSFISASPVPTVAGNTLTWNIAAFSSFQDRVVRIQLQVPPDISLLGTDLLFNASFITGNSDAETSNNTAALTTMVTGSYDPNDKTARTSSGGNNDLYFIDQDEWIDYTIRFQNTGSDTAFNVVITDTIPPELDLGSFEEGASSHPHALSIREGHVLRWAFYDIQLPDSNVNEPRSHGFVSFRIRPRQPVLPGTMIGNIANIYFDFNPPVITEPSLLVAEFSTGAQEQEQGEQQLRLLPNPTNDLLRISSDGTIDAITIIASDGREVLRRSARSSNSTLDVSGLRAGSYFLIATLNNGSLARARFIKQ